VARLRIKIFAEYPYLYDGDFNYETDYLRLYTKSHKSIFILARNSEDLKIIGASTGLPLIDANNAFQKPFLDKDINIDNIFYFGESVLLPEYRNQNIGRNLFEIREKVAKNLGYKNYCFCSVINSTEPPLYYKSPERIWIKQGYIKQNDILCSFDWKDIDSDIETKKDMVFWLKTLKE
jgi:GNAT superfamily N-acetyltransferase